MILQIVDAAGRPRVIDATRVVIFLPDGVTPVAAAVDLPGGAVEVEQAADRDGRPDPRLARMLQAQGMDRSLILGRSPLRRLADLRFDGGPAGA